MSRTALIVGCGVAGPAVALFLRRAGWEPLIFEAAAHPDDYAGLFLNVATNGLHVLASLGLREALLADAHRCPNMVMWSGRGKRLGQVPNGPAGQPQRGSVVRSARRFAPRAARRGAAPRHSHRVWSTTRGHCRDGRWHRSAVRQRSPRRG